jgi:hypothetical protein
MNNTEIIKKAIEKAVSNGYEVPIFFNIEASWADLLFVSRKIYFSHNFAKAFWGEDEYYIPTGKIKVWQYNLQEMVLEENPIDYLRKFI